MDSIKERQQTTAAPYPLILGDKEFFMSPLTDKDIATLDLWVQSRCIEVARNSLPPDASQEMREETIKAAIEISMSLTWMSGRGAKILATVEGMTRLVWQCCRKNHPTLTVDELRSHLLDPSNIERANEAFARLNKVEQETQSKKETELKNVGSNR